MDVIYYLVFAHVKDVKIRGRIGNVAARNRAEAIEFAIDNFRKEANLKTSVHVFTKVVYETPDPQKADDYYHGFISLVEEEEAKNAPSN